MGNQNEKPCEQIRQIYHIYSKSLINKQRSSHNTSQKITKDILKQLFQSFTRYPQYSWSQQITPLFQTFFIDNIGTLWANDKQIFYRQMLENSGLIQEIYQGRIKKTKNYESLFYGCQAIKLKQSYIQSQIVQQKIDALNSSIVDEPENVPFIFGKKKAAERHQPLIMKSMMNQKIERDNFSIQTENSTMSQYYDEQILRSSVIIPQTVFVERLNEQSRSKLNNMLNFYKVFSESLQQIIKSLSLMACPLKHFEISLKRRVKLKKIKSAQSTSSLLKDTRNAGIQRKKMEYNNTYLLQQIRDFTQSYTQFIWKYLDLYRIAQTQFSTFITVQTAYGVVLKHIWTFASWIGQRGFGFQERLIPKAVQKLQDEQIKLSQIQNKKNKKPKKIQVDPQIVKLGCQLSLETNPQKYLKKIVIIYRELSKYCTNADQLILYYEALFQQLAKHNGYHRLFKMQLIITKLMKMQDSCGQIQYAWTTWNIMIQIIKRIISTDPKQKQIQQDFKAYLQRNQRDRLSNREV